MVCSNNIWNIYKRYMLKRKKIYFLFLAYIWVDFSKDWIRYGTKTRATFCLEGITSWYYSPPSHITSHRGTDGNAYRTMWNVSTKVLPPFTDTRAFQHHICRLMIGAKNSKMPISPATTSNKKAGDEAFKSFYRHLMTKRGWTGSALRRFNLQFQRKEKNKAIL